MLEQTHFQKLARAMSRRFDVNVVMTETKCSTDGENIYIPYNSDHIQDRQALNGLLDHEVAHIIEEREHAKKGLTTPLQYMRRSPDQKTSMLFNIIEDIRIEKKYSRIYPGMSQNIAAANGYCVGALKKKKLGFWDIIGARLTCAAHGFDFDWLPNDWMEYFSCIQNCVDATDYLVTAADSWSEAQKLAAEIEETLVEDPKKASTKDLMDALRQEVASQSEVDAKTTLRYIPNGATLAADVWRVPKTGPGESYAESRAIAIQQINGLKGRLAYLLRSLQAPIVMYGNETGRLNKKQLAGVVVGRKDVYKRTLPGVEIDTSILILLDMSGSMGPQIKYERSWYAKLVCITLAETFDSLGIPFEIIGFHNDWSKRIKCAKHCVRNEVLVYDVFKSRSEQYRRVKSRLDQIRGHGNNTDGEAVLAVAKRLAQHPETRKLMVVISDGRPHGGNVPCELLEQHLYDTVRLVTRSGIGVLGIGVTTDFVEKFYNKSTGATSLVVMDLNKLVYGVYEKLDEIIRRELCQ